jgi:hypothetical protein
LAPWIAWILGISGAVTALGGLLAAAVPRPFLLAVFGVGDADAALAFFARHWGVLIFVVGALLVYAAYDPSVRLPVLLAGAAEKLVIVAMIFFGSLKRTRLMTVAAIADGTFAILYLADIAKL